MAENNDCSCLQQPYNGINKCPSHSHIHVCDKDYYCLACCKCEYLHPSLCEGNEHICTCKYECLYGFEEWLCRSDIHICICKNELDYCICDKTKSCKYCCGDIPNSLCKIHNGRRVKSAMKK